MHFEVNYIGWPGVECRRAPRNATRWGLLSVDPSHPAEAKCIHDRELPIVACGTLCAGQ
jgi:hypothetical protein